MSCRCQQCSNTILHRHRKNSLLIPNAHLQESPTPSIAPCEHTHTYTQLLVTRSATVISKKWWWCYLVAKSRPTLCNPVGYSPPGSSVHGFSQTRILVPFPSPEDLPDPGIEPMSPALQVDLFFFLTILPPGKPKWCIIPQILKGSVVQSTLFHSHSFVCISHGSRSESRILTGNQPPW